MISTRWRQVITLAVLPSFQLLFGAFPNAEGVEENHPELRSEELTVSPMEGPLTIRSQGLFQQLRLSLIPQPLPALQKGQWQLRQLFTWASLWGWREGSLAVDAETVRTAVCLDYGLSDSLGLSLEVPFLWRGGGIMDSMIDEFHSLTGTRTAGRENFPRRQLHVGFSEHGQWIELLHNSDEGIGLGDAVVSGQYLIPSSNAEGLLASVGAAVKVPTGDSSSLYGSGGVDAGVWLLLAKQVGSLNLYASLGVVCLGKNEIEGLLLQKGQGSALLAAELAVSRKSSLILQYLYTSAAARDLPEFSTGSHEVAWGFRTLLGKGFRLEAAAMENVINYDNSPDFGFYLGLCQRF